MNKTILLILAVAVLQIPVFASPTSTTVMLNQSNTFADGIDYGSVQINANDSTGKVFFTVDAFTAPYDSLSNFGIQSFGFNSTIATGNLTISDLPTGWTQGSGNEDGFGSFQITTDGKGNSRQDPLTFTVTTSNVADALVSNFLVLSSGGNSSFFAAHIAGFTVDGSNDTSHFVASGGTPVVPAPGAVLLGGIGVAIVGWMRGRKTL